MKIFIILMGFVYCNSIQLSKAQGTAFLSNLSDSEIGVSAVGSDVWWGQTLQTGTNTEGYILNSVQLKLDAPSGAAHGFNLSISQSNPNIFIGNLSGPDPTSSGMFTYIGAGIHLLPSSQYFLVVSASSLTTDGAYMWSYSSAPPNAVGGWSIMRRYRSTDGVNWLIADRSSAFQFAVYATAVPEPSSLALLGLGGSFLFTRLARKSRSKGLRQP